MASTYEPEQAATAAAARRGIAVLFRRLFREKPFGAAGLIVVLLFFLIGVFANQLAPHDYADQDVPRRLEGPSAEFLLGTDQFGRDSLSRIIHGARISMVVGLLASTFTVLTATMLGVTSGYWGGTFDLVLQRFVDAVMSFPWLFLVLTAMLLLGPSILSIAIVIGVPWGIANVRTIRSVVLSVKENAYVEAARATGARALGILARHILPQTIAPNIILFTITLGSAIIGEATVSFLGFRHSAAAADLGRHAQCRGPQVHGGGPRAVPVARTVPGDRGVRDQHIRRRVARSARPPPARRRGAFRHSRPAELSRLISDPDARGRGFRSP